MKTEGRTPGDTAAITSPQLRRSDREKGKKEPLALGLFKTTKTRLEMVSGDDDCGARLEQLGLWVGASGSKEEANRGKYVHGHTTIFRKESNSGVFGRKTGVESKQSLGRPTEVWDLG
ncbi:hypothetical protein LXL04_015471 [Taraxacum kok-saghyz]